MNRKERAEYQRKYYRAHSEYARLYQRWYNMINRCVNPRTPGYKYYGERGIGICDEWRESFRTFMGWALKNGYQPNLQLDREDNEGDYSPENCRFVTCAENAGNRRASTRNLTFQGKSKSLSNWARDIGISRQALTQRLDVSGWSIERALTTVATTPKMRGRRKGTYTVAIHSSVYRDRSKRRRLIVCPDCGYVFSRKNAKVLS